jgi:phosphoribosylformimino-5-aminoimidazole carboxamide ribotide isomerase
MKIIPVIDLLGGQVVHAVKGQRANYQPLKSTLCSSCEPVDVANALLRHTHSETLYIADLDALIENKPQTQLIDTLQAKLPHGIELWLDSGHPPPIETRSGLTPVIGSESLNRDTWAALKSRPAKNWILSLDFFNGVPKGYARLLTQPEFWPDRVIVMSLDHVGSFNGPDWSRLENILALAPAHCGIIAAGGIRHQADILRLSTMGVSAVLAASALHAGVISS